MADDRAPVEQSTYRLFLDHTRTTLVRIWSDGQMEVAQRDDPRHTWGPPVFLTEERDG